MPEKTRVGYIDALKGFAILCVVVGHAANSYTNSNMYSSSLFLYDLHNLIYAFHMPLFFIISGFLYKISYIKSEKADTKRIKWNILNYFSIYILYSILMILVQFVLSKYVNEQITLDMLFLLPVKPSGVYWYLYVLAELYLIFCFDRFRTIPCRYMLPGLLLVNLVGNAFVPSSFWFHLRSLCYYLLFFYLGILLCDSDKYLIFKRKVVIVMGVVSCGLCLAYWSHNDPINGIPIVNVFVGFGLSLLLFFLFKDSSFLSNSPVLRYIGKYSLGIYLFHTYFTSGFRQVDRFLQINNVYISIVLNVLIGTIGSLCVAIIIKKLKISELCFKPASFLWNKIRKY